jgi:hypothetical protein
MKKMIAAVLAVAMVLVFSVPALAAVVETADLITDGGDVLTATDVGDIEVDYDAGAITVSCTAIDSPWVIVETHVYISTDAPRKHSPGKFPYEDGQAVSGFTTGDLVYIAYHAEIWDDNGTPEILDDDVYETVWAQTGDIDTLFKDSPAPGAKGNKWATYFTYTIP